MLHLVLSFKKLYRILNLKMVMITMSKQKCDDSLSQIDQSNAFWKFLNFSLTASNAMQWFSVPVIIEDIAFIF